MRNSVSGMSNLRGIKKKRTLKYKKSIISYIFGIFTWSKNTPQPHNVVFLDYPWTCSINELLEIKHIKLDEICIGCTFKNNSDQNALMENKYNHNILLEMIQTDFKCKITNWFSDENVFFSDNKSSVYRFLQWVKYDKLRQINLDHIIAIIGKPYSIRITKSEFVIERSKINDCAFLESLVFKLQNVHTLSKKWNMCCSVQINRIYEPLSCDMSPQVNYSDDHHLEARYQIPVYSIRLSLDMNKLIDVHLHHITEFDEDIYALGDLSIIKF